MSYEAAAQKVLDERWYDSMPGAMSVDPIIIARDLGINVYKAPMAAGISGYIIKRGAEYAPDIFINEQHAPVRQRFTVAHELGHYFQRKEMAPPACDKYALKRAYLASCGTDEEEIFANGFAASLLMPRDVMAHLVDSGFDDLSIAKRLQVSLDSVEFRIKNLGLRP
ncbi:ImmA/IrrE family metallo-endopeptidase [Corynebacterium sp. zg-331]|uniref:ImmA/IrrE family metallo-endopeptidase n=1 Tax=unclassified Corynebacterium TaxID=2624378 RepID=UPI0016425CB9|nr:ImmA/IrrE family metallo-endopeptidase [Corynebacterium sp. zg-331]